MTPSTVVAVGCLVLTLGVVVRQFTLRARVFGLVGPGSYKSCRTLTRRLIDRGTPASKLRASATLAILFSLALFVRYRLSHPHWEEIGDAWLACAILFLSVAVRLQVSMPAMVILLGASRQTCRHLQDLLGNRLRPLRVASLLRPDGGLLRQDANASFRLAENDPDGELERWRAEKVFGQPPAAGDPSRLEGPDAWREAVRQLMAACPIVVFDCREVTPLVTGELEVARAIGAEPKVVCLTGENSPPIPAGVAAVGTVAELLSLLAPIADGRAPPPSPSSPLESRVWRPFERVNAPTDHSMREEAVGGSVDEHPVRIRTADHAWAIQALAVPKKRNAAELFEKAMNAEGGMAKMLWWLLFRPWMGSRPYERALRFYTKALEAEPECAKIQTAVGILLARIGSPMDALGHFLRANDLQPGNAWVEANLSALYFEMGNHRRSEEFRHLAESRRR